MVGRIVRSYPSGRFDVWFYPWQRAASEGECSVVVEKKTPEEASEARERESTVGRGPFRYTHNGVSHPIEVDANRDEAILIPVTYNRVHHFTCLERSIAVSLGGTTLTKSVFMGQPELFSAPALPSLSLLLLVLRLRCADCLL